MHFGGLKNLRWLASQQRTWVAMYDNYEMIVEHLKQAKEDEYHFKKEEREAKSKSSEGARHSGSRE